MSYDLDADGCFGFEWFANYLGAWTIRGTRMTQMPVGSFDACLREG